MIQSSCSELLVDTQIHDLIEAYWKFKALFEKFNWESSPPLSIELLQELQEKNKKREHDDNTEIPRIIVYDKDGNRAWLEYGYNGYITTGFRFDSHCNQCDNLCFPIFQKIIKELHGELIACDGGSTDIYEEWEFNKLHNP